MTLPPGWLAAAPRVLSREIANDKWESRGFAVASRSNRARSVNECHAARSEGFGRRRAPVRLAQRIARPRARGRDGGARQAAPVRIGHRCTIEKPIQEWCFQLHARGPCKYNATSSVTAGKEAHRQ